jgi:S-(hydroxymethyl)glutathione dehydrogenase/alcohol dehydrogenase
VRGLLSRAGLAVLVDDLQLGSPRPDEVVVRVHYCGLCQTDLHLMDGTLDFAEPRVCGHEVSGVVEDVGSIADADLIGRPVVVAPRPPCRVCWWCANDQPQLCAGQLRWATGTRPDGTSPLSWHGAPVALGVGVAGFADRVITPVASLVPIPDDLPMQLAAILGCAVLTGSGAVLHGGHVRAGSSVLVMGLGGVGLSAVLAAKAAGAGPVIAADVREDRRLAAIAAGADQAIDPNTCDVVAVVADATEGRGADVAIDAVGDVRNTVPIAFSAIRAGGRLVIAGVPPSGAQITLPAAQLVSDERHVSGCFIGSADPMHDIPMLIDMWRAGRFALEQLVTNVIALDDLAAVITGGDTPAGVRTVVRMQVADE